MAVQRIDDPDQFAFYTDWSENPDPDIGTLVAPSIYSEPANTYDYGDLVITISIQTRVKFMRCSQDLFNGDFAENAACILGKNEGANLPVHITFDPPVARVGARVSADTMPGETYLRQLGVKALPTDQWDVVTATGPVTTKRGRAPFLGARYSEGKRISEAWFDVVNVPGNNFDILQVAIGNLHYTL